MAGAIGKQLDPPADAEGPADQTAEPAGEPAAGADQQPPQGGQESQATPEEQDAYDRAVIAGVKVIFDDATRPAIIKMLQSQTDDPPQGIAQATATVIKILEEHSKGQLPGVIIMDLADEIAGNIMALGEKMGLFKADENMKGQAAQQINILLANAYPPSPEEVNGLVSSKSPEELAKIQQQQSGFAGGA